MHSTRQAPRVRKARQPAGNSSTRRDKQRQSSIIQDPNQFSGIPDIGVPELIRFLQTVGIAAIEEDVLEPTSRRTREMCELLLQYFVPHRTKFLQIQKEKAATEFKESLASIMDINCLCVGSSHFNCRNSALNMPKLCLYFMNCNSFYKRLGSLTLQSSIFCHLGHTVCKRC